MQADPEWLSTFDDAIVELLKWFGITNTAIIGLVILAFSLKSWMDGISSSVGIASRGFHRFSETTRGLRLHGTSVAVLLTILVGGAIAAT